MSSVFWWMFPFGFHEHFAKYAGFVGSWLLECASPEEVADESAQLNRMRFTVTWCLLITSNSGNKAAANEFHYWNENFTLSSHLNLCSKTFRCSRIPLFCHSWKSAVMRMTVLWWWMTSTISYLCHIYLNNYHLIIMINIHSNT